MNNTIYDSTYVQILSIQRFAAGLGWDFDGRSFNKKDKGKTYFCSFESMQYFHNGPCKVSNYHVSPYSVWFDYDMLCVCREDWDYAMKQKLVHLAKLQYHKKFKRYVAQDNKVKLVEGDV